MNISKIVYQINITEVLRLLLKIEWIFLFAEHPLVMIMLKYYYINNVLYHLEYIMYMLNNQYNDWQKRNKRIFINVIVLSRS